MAPAAAPALTPGMGPDAFGALQHSAGNRAVTTFVQRANAGGNAQGEEKERTQAVNARVIIQPWYASGDQFGIAATLIDDPEKHVYITHGHDERQESAARNVAKFYEDSGIASVRVHVVEAVKQGDAKKQAKKDAKERGADVSNSEIQPLGTGTTYVGAKFSDEMRGKVREAWKLNGDQKTAHEKDRKVEEWLGAKGVDAAGRNIAILWSRFSGKSGEVHLEHDTGYLGIAQIIAGLSSLDLVLIVGDAAPKNKKQAAGRAPKYDAIAAAYNGTDEGKGDEKGGKVKVPGFGAKVVNLTGFWNDPGFKEWGGESRTGQFLLFDYLNRHAAAARHLGFRSGNLEAMALMGFTVRYMEEPGSIGGDRMEKWHAHPQGSGETRGGGTAPGYERLAVEFPPTRSGRRQRALPEEVREKVQKNAQWYQDRLEQNPEDREAKSGLKGFSDKDLADIDAYLLGQGTR
ncbi:hypothetical protein AB0L06_19435 [Spirillospora sp. NPDC052269]